MTLRRRKSGLDERSGDGKKNNKDNRAEHKIGCKKSLLLLLQERRPERKSTSHAKYKRADRSTVISKYNTRKLLIDIYIPPH